MPRRIGRHRTTSPDASRARLPGYGRGAFAGSGKESVQGSRGTIAAAGEGVSGGVNRPGNVSWTGTTASLPPKSRTRTLRLQDIGS